MNWNSFRIAPLVLLAAVAAAQPLPPRGPRQVAFTNSPRLTELVRGGTLELSLRDAVALAVENNLDIELHRFGLEAARAELLRAHGGGAVRGLNYVVYEAPSGVGGPAGSVITSPAARAGSGLTISTNPLEIGATSQVQSNLQLSTATPSSGPAVPSFDPTLVGRAVWQHLSTPQTNSLVSGVNNLITETSTGSAGLQQGFDTGTQLRASFDNSRQVLNSVRSSYSPFTTSGLQMSFVQPLMRGFGRGVNRRFIRIAQNENRIAGLLLKQQMLATVYGVARLYYDYVALYEDVRVKEESVAFAQKLREEMNSRFEEGTAAQVELTRAEAQVQVAKLDLERSRGLLEEQEAIFKNVITRTGSADPLVRNVRIVPSEAPALPTEEIRPVQDLVADAFTNRPDLEQGRYQIQNSEIVLQAAKSNLKPQIDLVATAQNTGLAGSPNPLAAQIDPTFVGGYGSAVGQIFRRNYPTYSAGVEIQLPIRNRVAEADAARDQVNLRQSEIRYRQLSNQVRLEIDNALTSMRHARIAYETAVQARRLQEQSLELEQAKYDVGASTSFFVMQFQTALAQSRSAEVVARSAWVKARAALQRATGSILTDFGIAFDEAAK